MSEESRRKRGGVVCPKLRSLLLDHIWYRLSPAHILTLLLVQLGDLGQVA